MPVNRRRFIQGSTGLSAIGAIGFMQTDTASRLKRKRALPCLIWIRVVHCHLAVWQGFLRSGRESHPAGWFDG